VKAPVVNKTTLVETKSEVNPFAMASDVKTKNSTLGNDKDWNAFV